MTYPTTYQPARFVAKGPQPGAKALMQWALEQYDSATNLGIYNPRNVRGGRSLSTHAEGRAIDVGFPVVRPDGHWQGSELAELLITNHANLGIQQVIWAGRIWRNTRSTQGWRRYTGQSDHYNHVHAELRWDAAQELTYSRVKQILLTTTSQEGDSMSPVDYVRMHFMQARSEDPTRTGNDETGLWYWVGQIHAEQPDRASWSPREIAVTNAASSMRAGLGTSDPF